MTRSEQRRADAMADAETLRQFFPLRTRGRTLVGRCGWYGQRIIEARPWLGDPQAVWVTHWAHEAAHAAFLAVPGLRG